MKKLLVILCMVMVAGTMFAGCPSGNDGGSSGGGGGNGGTLTPASFQISNLTIAPSEITAGDEITLTVTVANSGGQQGTYQLTLKIDSITVEGKSVTLSGNSSENVSFTAVINEAGDHQIEINSLSDDVAVARGGLGENFKYSMNVAVLGAGEIEATYWQKGDKVRMEMTMIIAGEDEITVVMIYRDGFVYIYDPATNQAIKYDAEGYIDGGTETFELFSQFYVLGYTDEAILAELQELCDTDTGCQSVEIIGHETIAGEYCTIFEYTPTEGESGKIWLAAEKGYVIKIEVESPEGTVAIEFTEIDLNPSIPDSTFDLPAGVEIIDMTGA